MIILPFLSHLDPEDQISITVALEEDALPHGSRLDIVCALCEEEAVLDKCIAYLDYQELFEHHEVPKEAREIVRAAVKSSELATGHKITCIRKAFGKPEFISETLKFLNNYVPQTKAAPAYVAVAEPVSDPIKLSIPVETSFPVLQKISEHLRDQVQGVLCDENLDNREKLGMLQQFVTIKTELTECRRHLKDREEEKKVLDSLPAETRGEVAAVFREETFSFQQKRDILKHILKSSDHRKSCRNYLKTKETTAKRYTTEQIQKREAIEMLERLPERMNILILGETGVGKSTFINGLANYLKYLNLHEAKAKGPEVLITCSFTHNENSTKGFRGQKIVVEPRDGDSSNENLDDGKSSTLFPKYYKFQGDFVGEHKEIFLIDTPGVGDVDGLEKDSHNFTEIFSYLADLEKIDAICILLKPNEARLTDSITYCLGELLSRLHKDCAANIIFCFTNTRGNFYKPGETAATLKAFLKQMEDKWGVKIPNNRASLFSFDNESFRFLCAWKKVHFDEKYVENFNTSWESSVKEAFRLLTRVAQLPPREMDKTLAIYNIRSMINMLLKPIDEKAKRIKTIEAVIRDKHAEKLDLEKDQKEAQSETHAEETKVFRQAINRVDTVCQSCGEFDKINPAEKHYKICHQNCNCVNTKMNVLMDAKIQACSCIDKSTLKCTTCGCLWNLHMRRNDQIAYRKEKVVDAVGVNKMLSLKKKSADAGDKVSQLLAEKTALLQQMQQLSNSIEMLAGFLSKYSLLPYNQYLKNYVEKSIEELKKRGEQTKKNKDLIGRLQQMGDEHDQLANIIDKMESKTVWPICDAYPVMEQIKRDARGLSSELKSFIPLRVRSAPTKRVKIVGLNDGWLGKLEEQE